MSTTTSNTDPDAQVTYLAWLGGTWAKCKPRSTPADDTEQLACRTSKPVTGEAAEPAVGEPFEEMPRESP